jgi:hypothetical protein
MTRPPFRRRKSASASRAATGALIAASLLLGAPLAGAGDEVGIRATGLSGGLPFTVYFAARVPREMGGATVEWDFGDGGASQEPRTYHTFIEPGLYTVRLMVRFAGGSAFTSTVQVLAHSGG